MTSASPPANAGKMRRVSFTTLGCARNEVDSDELRARLRADGWEITTEDPDVVVVNTCGFIASAKQESIDTILDAADGEAPVVVTGCLAERYGRELAAELPEAAAVLGFDAYDNLSNHLSAVLAGERIEAHEPVDRRTLIPITPTERSVTGTPGSAGLQRPVTAPSMSVKLASGCDRRCSFCAIPSFRGAFVSRRPSDVLAEATMLVQSGAREIELVSENSTSYGKDLGDLRLLEELLPAIGAIPGIVRTRVNYLQPAEIRPGLERVIATTPGVAPYFDMSFQHASPSVLRRMRRFGGSEDFLGLLERIRRYNPSAGVRTNVIVGFPGETEDDFEILLDFLRQARLDAIGVFGYSDEEGTEAVHLDDHVPQWQIDERVSQVSALADELMCQRAEERIGETVRVLIDYVEGEHVEGRADHQGPEDSRTILSDVPAQVGDVLHVEIVDVDGVDLIGQLS
jgi:ribosomal protein S12 methylthiotransferase